MEWLLTVHPSLLDPSQACSDEGGWARGGAAKSLKGGGGAHPKFNADCGHGLATKPSAAPRHRTRALRAGASGAIFHGRACEHAVARRRPVRRRRVTTAAAAGVAAKSNERARRGPLRGLSPISRAPAPALRAACKRRTPVDLPGARERDS